MSLRDEFAAKTPRRPCQVVLAGERDWGDTTGAEVRELLDDISIPAEPLIRFLVERLGEEIPSAYQVQAHRRGDCTCRYART